MFLGKRKSREPAEEESSLYEGEVTENEKPVKEAAEGGDAMVKQITGLEELVGQRTRDLENAREQLKNLYHDQGGLDQNKDEAKADELLIQPHRPKGELSVEPEEEAPDKGKEIDNLFEKAGEEEAEAPEKEEESEAPSDDFFSGEEEEENPLAGLISSFSEVTIEELLHEAEQVKVLASEWQQD